MYTVGSMWYLLIILKPILTLSLVIYVIEKWCVISFTEKNSDHSNFFPVREESLYKKK